MTDGHLSRPSRTGIEIGVVVTIGAFLLGLSFNAGIQYSKIIELDGRTIALESDVSRIQASQTPELERLARIEAILQDMRSQQRNETDALARAGIGHKPNGQ